jgi:hypothetical protein
LQARWGDLKDPKCANLLRTLVQAPSSSNLYTFVYQKNEEIVAGVEKILERRDLLLPFLIEDLSDFYEQFISNFTIDRLLEFYEEIFCLMKGAESKEAVIALGGWCFKLLYPVFYVFQAFEVVENFLNRDDFTCFQKMFFEKLRKTLNADNVWEEQKQQEEMSSSNSAQAVESFDRVFVKAERPVEQEVEIESVVNCFDELNIDLAEFKQSLIECRGKPQKFISRLKAHGFLVKSSGRGSHKKVTLPSGHGGFPIPKSLEAKGTVAAIAKEAVNLLKSNYSSYKFDDWSDAFMM